MLTQKRQEKDLKMRQPPISTKKEENFAETVLKACRLSIHPYIRHLLQEGGTTYDYETMQNMMPVDQKRVAKFIEKHASSISLLMIRERSKHVKWTVKEVAPKLREYLEASELGVLLKKGNESGSKLILGINVLPQLYLLLHPEIGLITRTQRADKAQLASSLSDRKVLRQARKAGLIPLSVKRVSQITNLVSQGVNTIVEDKQAYRLFKDFDQCVKMISYSSSQSFSFDLVNAMNSDRWIHMAKKLIKPQEGSKAQKHLENVVDGICFSAALARRSPARAHPDYCITDDFSELSFNVTFDPINLPFLDSTILGIRHINEGILNVCETAPILKDVQDKGGKPDILLLGLAAFMSPCSESISEDYMLFAVHKNATFQIVTNDEKGGVPKEVRVVEDAHNAAEWTRVQNRILNRAHAKKNVVGHVDSYKEAFEYYRQGKIDFGVLRNPVNFFLQSSLPNLKTANMQVISEQTHLKTPNLGYAALLARKDRFSDSPELLHYAGLRLLNICNVFQKNPCSFIINSEATDFHRYLLQMTEVSQSCVKKEIGQNILDLRFS